MITEEITISKIVNTARVYAVNCHTSTGHFYNGWPYSYHLEMVVGIAEKFIHLVPEQDRDNVLAACWCHDVIEDCRQTYNDVKQNTNEVVAELVYALTNEKGRNRKERGNEKYYAGIRNTPNAAFIKICDRIANYKFSKDNQHRMASMYEREMPDFIEKLYEEQYKELFDYIEKL